MMRVLIACEESQRVCEAFRKRGHEAYSCDIIDPSGGHPEWHLKGDCLDYIDQHWDLIIAHPPCTYLSKLNAPLIVKDSTRIQKGVEAAEFFMKLYNAPCDKICIENPVPLKRWGLPQYSQIIRPYEYGELALKPTCLWLKGLPLLKPTKILDKSLVPRHVRIYKGLKKSTSVLQDNGTAKSRSKTFVGIAEAMADQWG